jgi:hypothetical protein
VSEPRASLTDEVIVAAERLRVTSPAPRRVWRELQAEDPFALVTQTPEWLESMCELGRYADASRLYEREDGRRLVLPMVRRRPGGGSLALESSFGEGWGMGGLVGPGGVTLEDVSLVVGDLAARTVLRTLIRPNPLLASEWAAACGPSVRAVPRLAHVLDLEDGFDHVWRKRFTHMARNNVRRAERAGLVVERGSGDEHVEAFYRLFEASLERWSAKQHEPLWLTRLRGHLRDPARKFRVLARRLGDAFSIWLALSSDRPVAASVVLRGANAHCIRAVFDERAARTSGPNYLLHACAIRDACDAGCRHYHFGESGHSTPLAFFKTRFGATAYPYAEYRLERLPLTPVDRTMRRAAKRLVGFVEPA